jgi:Helix-turn-helix domain
MTLDESVHGMRLRVIERAQVHGNVSAVCRELGISRTVFYRWRKRLERYGVDGVHPRHCIEWRVLDQEPSTTLIGHVGQDLGLCVSAGRYQGITMLYAYSTKSAC